MPTVRKRNPYQFQAQVRRRGYPPQTKTFETEHEAWEWAYAVEAEMKRGGFVSRSLAEKTSLAQLLERYATEVAEHQKGKRQYLSLIRQLSSRLGKFSISSVTPMVVSKYRDERSKEVGPQAVKHDLSMLSRVFNTAIKEWGFALPFGNPVSQIRMPRLPLGRNRRLKPGEIELILKSTDSPMIGKIIIIALETAMRREEIVKLMWEDVDFKKKTLYVADPKNRHPRTVPLFPEALKILKTLKAGTIRIDGSVFGISKESITQAFSRARKRARAKIEDEARKNNKTPDPHFLMNLHFHDLRHEATSLLFEKRKLDIVTVSEITGHRDLKMLRRYAHPNVANLVKGRK
ncbi:MAG: site-specific integrase [Nitrososphaerales archaeon]